mgnify:CR=1 FL=1
MSRGEAPQPPRHQWPTPKEWFDDWGALDSTYTGYAGRDIDKYPNLESNPGNQAIVCDDNELADTEDHPQPNHQYATVVLYANGAVRDMDVVKLREEGVIGQGKYIIPGPDCEVEELRTRAPRRPRAQEKGCEVGRDEVERRRGESQQWPEGHDGAAEVRHPVRHGDAEAQVSSRPAASAKIPTFRTADSPRIPCP